MAYRGEGVNNGTTMPDIIDRLEALLHDIKVERHVFKRLSNVLREDNGVQLSSVAAELETLQTMLEEAIKGLRP